ncbi:hypothetical protein Goshw_006924 [Gossypium schwendimanii]|uniref:Uncharacterized protein n=1 Tax=Gossypium schwendimanii TaxID=34291 RepID=A0A7J9MA50_GOSSC|nr:hypothetical protein [Gossypium schwendimanii]
MSVDILVESRGPARVYVVREPKDQDPTDVIVATFTLQSVLLFSLVDSGSKHSYILSELAYKLGIHVETIGLGMTVISSFGDKEVSNLIWYRYHFSRIGTPGGVASYYSVLATEPSIGCYRSHQSICYSLKRSKDCQGIMKIGLCYYYVLCPIRIKLLGRPKFMVNIKSLLRM